LTKSRRFSTCGDSRKKLSMYSVIAKFAEVVAAMPDAVLNIASVSSQSPSTNSDMPCIVVSLEIDSLKTTGLGRVIRWGETITKHTGIVPVASTPETFTGDLKELRISPLPLRKNPSSVGEYFNNQDIQVTNVTDAAHPETYRFVVGSKGKNEYEIDEARAAIRFGAPQAAGDRLEVIHWTVTWKDDIKGKTYHGLMTLDVCAGTLNDAANVSRKLQDRLYSGRPLSREKGFSILHPCRLGPTEQVLHTPAEGSSFTVWKQQLAYKFSFEAEDPVELTSGVPIKQIDVDIKGHVQDSLSIP
jgi:hypothetical protein